MEESHAFVVFLVWIVFNGRITLEITLFGIAVSVLILLFICKFMDYSLAAERRFYRLMVPFCRYALLLVLCLTWTVWHHHEHRKDLEHWFVLRYAAFKENATLIGRSPSFGLVLFSFGLCATLVYLLVSTFG